MKHGQKGSIKKLSTKIYLHIEFISHHHEIHCVFLLQKNMSYTFDGHTPSLVSHP